MENPYWAKYYNLASSQCGDDDHECPEWAAAGDCNHEFRQLAELTKEHCKKSCGVCGK